MTLTLKINARNDIHLPSEVLKLLNVGKDRILKAQVEANSLTIIPVDLEPRYSHEELEGLEKLHRDQKEKGWTFLHSEKDIDELFK
jgi:antitoxin component of MazEF toxin-antitoxin module